MLLHDKHTMINNIYYCIFLNLTKLMHLIPITPSNASCGYTI